MYNCYALVCPGISSVLLFSSKLVHCYVLQSTSMSSVRINMKHSRQPALWKRVLVLKAMIPTLPQGRFLHRLALKSNVFVKLLRMSWRTLRGLWLAPTTMMRRCCWSWTLCSMRWTFRNSCRQLLVCFVTVVIFRFETFVLLLPSQSCSTSVIASRPTLTTNSRRLSI